MAHRPKYFKLHELVSRQVLAKYGATAWQFFDPRLLIILDWLREKLGKRITVNNWRWGGQFSQRGLRCNMDPIVLSKTEKGVIYCSPHPNGQAADFDVEDMTAFEVRWWLIEHQYELPYPIRLEEGVNWVHLDVRDTGKPIYIFLP
jgi:hypothetical protein